MIKRFIATFTLLSYLIISLLSTGQDVLCIHNSGFSSFESMINDECVSIDLKKHIKTNKISFSKVNIDSCCDMVILKDLRNKDSKIFSLSLLSTNIIVNHIIKYFPKLDIEPDNKIYIAKIEQNKLIEKSNINYISTFVLTI